MKLWIMIGDWQFTLRIPDSVVSVCELFSPASLFRKSAVQESRDRF
jgi:hypothetical protein